jgi:hypothetical protein
MQQAPVSRGTYTLTTSRRSVILHATIKHLGEFSHGKSHYSEKSNVQVMNMPFVAANAYKLQRERKRFKLY